MPAAVSARATHRRGREGRITWRPGEAENLGEAQNIRYEQVTNTRNPITSAVSIPLPAAGSESNRAATCSTSSSLKASTRAFAFVGTHALPLERSPDAGAVEKRAQKLARRKRRLPRGFDPIGCNQLRCAAGIGSPRVHRPATRARAMVRFRVAFFSSSLE